MIQAPAWIGIVLIVLGIALTVTVFVRRVPRRAARLAALLGTILLVTAGWYFTASRTTLEPRGFYVEDIHGEQERVGWLQVTHMASAPAGARDPELIVLQLRGSRETSIDLAALAPDERAKVLAYVKSRLNR